MNDLGKAQKILRVFKENGAGSVEDIEWATKFMEEFRVLYRKGLEEDAERQKQIANEWSCCDADGLKEDD